MLLFGPMIPYFLLWLLENRYRASTPERQRHTLDQSSSPFSAALAMLLFPDSLVEEVDSQTDQEEDIAHSD